MKRVAVVSDYQVPYHDPRHVSWVLDQVKEFEPTHLVVNGDLLDSAGISRFNKEDVGHRLLDEYQQGATVLRDLREAAGKRLEECWWVWGNHEDRLQSSYGTVPKFLEACLHPENQPECEEYDHWRRLPYAKTRGGILRLGKLWIFHGMNTRQNPEAFDLARVMGSLSGQLVVFGHTHNPFPPRQVEINRKPIDLWFCNTGCYCSPRKMDWTRRIVTSHWGPGVGLFETDSKGWSGTVMTP